MMSRGTPVKYLRCENAREHQSKLQKACEKEKIMLEYTTLHTYQLNIFIQRIFAVTKEGVLAILLNAKLNEIDHKILWAEDVHTYERVKKYGYHR